MIFDNDTVTITLTITNFTFFSDEKSSFSFEEVLTPNPLHTVIFRDNEKLNPFGTWVHIRHLRATVRHDIKKNRKSVF